MDTIVKISRGELVLRAKDETFLSAKTYLAAGVGNQDAVYEMQADERATHERKLLGSIAPAVSALKAALSRWQIQDTLTDGNDEFNLVFKVSDRVDTSRQSDVERLVKDYLYQRIVADWWVANYPNSAGNYLAATEKALGDLKKCFLLLPPQVGDRYVCESKDNVRYVYLYKEDLLNGVHEELLKVSKERMDGNGFYDMLLQTSEIFDEDLLKKYIQRYAHRAGERIMAYLQLFEETAHTEKEAIEYGLTLPCTWNPVLFNQLGEEMFEYVLKSCVHEWVKTYLPDLSLVYQMQANAASDNMKHIVTTRRPGAMRKPLQPF